MKILEELWFGTINPSEQYLQGDAEYQDMLRVVDAEKEKIFSILSPDGQRAMDDFLDIQLGLDVMAERKAFLAGFRLGAKILAAALRDG